jgi:hypothetical protein
VQEGKAVVIILEIERVPHSLGELFDKAEHTFVGAGMLSIHQGCFKFKTDIVIFSLFDHYRKGRVVSDEFYGKRGVGQIKAVSRTSLISCPLMRKRVSPSQIPALNANPPCVTDKIFTMVFPLSVLLFFYYSI